MPTTNGTIENGHGPKHHDVSAKTRSKWEAVPVTEHVPGPVQDLTMENITPNVIAVNSNVTGNPRLQYLITKLIQVAHDYVRDVELSFDEWTQAWEFLTKVRLFECDEMFCPVLTKYTLRSAKSQTT